MFFDVWKYMYSESLFNALYIEIKQMFKNSFRQNKRYKKYTLFFSRAPTDHSFTFN